PSPGSFRTKIARAFLSPGAWARAAWSWRPKRKRARSWALPGPGAAVRVKLILAKPLVALNFEAPRRLYRQPQPRPKAGRFVVGGLQSARRFLRFVSETPLTLCVRGVRDALCVGWAGIDEGARM